MVAATVAEAVEAVEVQAEAAAEAEAYADNTTEKGGPTTTFFIAL